MNRLIEELFGKDSGLDEPTLAELAGVLEAAAKSDKLTVNKKPLAKALADLGIDSPDLVAYADGLVLNLDSEEDYRLMVTELGTLDKLNQLAELGWVPVLGGESTTNAGPANYQIKFIELDHHDEEASDSTKFTPMQKLLKPAVYAELEEPDLK